MPKPKKVGRPKLAKGEAKAHVVVVRLHAEDYKQVTAAAKSGKKTVSEFVRRSVLQHITKDDVTKMIDLFSHARNFYEKAGPIAKAKECDLAIALVQYIAMDERLCP